MIIAPPILKNMIGASLHQSLAFSRLSPLSLSLSLSLSISLEYALYLGLWTVSVFFHDVLNGGGTSHYLGAAFVYFAIGRPAVVIAILIERASFMPQIPPSPR